MMKMLFGYNFGKLSIAVIPQTQKKAEKEDWAEIDPNSLEDSLQDLYLEYKDRYQAYKDSPAAVAMRDARAAFELGMRDTAGLKASPKVAKASKGSLSLADFLAGQANSGRQA